MKSKLVFNLLLASVFLFPGCYTVLLLDDATEAPAIETTPVSQPMIEYLPVYYPDPVPEPGPICGPPPLPPDSPTYIPTPPSSGDRREIQTGRGSANSNQEPARNNENTTRDSGAQRGGR